MFKFGRVYLIGLLLLTAVAALCTQAVAQSLISGDIAGTVTDPSGAVVPDATVVLNSLDTGSSQTATTNQTGSYRFRLLKPGHYTVTVSHAGFRKAQREVAAAVGVVATADLALELGQATQTVEVSAAPEVLSTEPSMNTPFTSREVEQLPSAGGDITNIAFTTPGVVVNVTGGYGNFTVNGLPASSNLFTVNGENDMDPFFNINNSGATNLTLGQNEVQEATVITNPYAGQYGQLAGAQVNYVTKSGTNKFHGNAQYWWNGRAMNANNWFNNSSDTPRPFSNANQWAASIGGPIRKNSTFFFVNTEGLRFILPNNLAAYIPTTAFANAVLANVQALQPNESTTYQKMFSVWAGAPGASSAVPIANSDACNALVLPNFDPTTQACAAQFQATPTALGSEWMLMARVDQMLGANDNFFFRYKLDRGVQPTTLDPISPNFNAISHQPSWDTQLHETHIFGSKSTNSFTAALSHYVAQFQQDQQLALDTFPYAVITSGTVEFTAFNPAYQYPQGRNITQYQFIDDFALIRGKHNLKFGANFRRYDVSDHGFYWNTPAVYFGYTDDGLQKFADGLGYQYRKSLNLSSNVPIAQWGLGLYAQDEWAVTPQLKLTLALRAERNSNPVCQSNCFANFKGGFSTLASFTSADPSSVPYNSDIIFGQHQAFPGMDKLDLSPRIGFSWSPMKDNKTVISGGFGIFYDAPATGLLENLLANPPVSVAIRVRPEAGVLPFDPAGGAASWAASAAAFSMTKTYSQIASELEALGSTFYAPAVTSFVGTYNAPRWEEWNLQLQRQLTNSTVLTVNYVGNRGSRIPYANSWPNNWDPYGILPGVTGVNVDPPVPNYGVVTQWQSGAISNYNGLTVSLRKQFSNRFAAHLNYTWSHNLDESSNGGDNAAPYTLEDSATQEQISPIRLRAANYGDSDYDIRHNFSADWVANPSPHFDNPVLKQVLGGWQWSGKVFWRTGLPFSVWDSTLGGIVFNTTALLLAQPTSGNGQSSCGAAAATTPCLNASAFVNTGAADWYNYTSFPTQTRNQYRGPHYFNADMALFKTFAFGEKMTLGVGVQAFNVFNHPNFGLPNAGLGSGTFGLISSMANSPTTPYGNLLGFDSSVRVVQLSAKIVF